LIFGLLLLACPHKELRIVSEMKNNLFKINNIVWDCTKKELKATGLPTSIPLFEVDCEDEICETKLQQNFKC